MYEELLQTKIYNRESLASNNYYCLFLFQPETHVVFNKKISLYRRQPYKKEERKGKEVQRKVIEFIY